MPEETGIHELLTLKTIAETLNSPNELKPMLDTVMGKLLDLTGNTAGWIFLSEENMEYECAANRGLPLALQRDNKQPMQWLQSIGVEAVPFRNRTSIEPFIRAYQGNASVYFNDPDGNSLEFMCHVEVPEHLKHISENITLTEWEKLLHLK